MLLEKSREIAPERMKKQSQKKKQHTIVGVTGDGRKDQCSKE